MKLVINLGRWNNFTLISTSRKYFKYFIIWFIIWFVENFNYFNMDLNSIIFLYFISWWSSCFLDYWGMKYAGQGVCQTIDEGSVEFINHIVTLPAWKLMESTLISKTHDEWKLKLGSYLLNAWYNKEIRYPMSLTCNYKIPLILLIAIYNNNELLCLWSWSRKYLEINLSWMLLNISVKNNMLSIINLPYYLILWNE